MKTLCKFMYEKYRDRTDKDNIYGVGISDSNMIDFLIDYLLGEDWRVDDVVGNNQLNEIALYEILKIYSPKFRREYKKWKKLLNKRDKLTKEFNDKFDIEIPIKNE